MGYLFTSESVSEGHPDKVADQISDAVLDELLAYDPSSKVACETLVTTGQVVLAGEVKSEAYVDLQEVARGVINKIGYTKGEYMFEGNSCGVFSAIHEQSPDINRGVERLDPMEQGAGDQGMMFGYATNETENYMPLSLDLAHKILYILAKIRKEGKQMTYLRPDAKSQVTIEYDDNGKPVRIDTIVVSTQHDEFILPKDKSHKSELAAEKALQQKIKEAVEKEEYENAAKFKSAILKNKARIDALEALSKTKEVVEPIKRVRKRPAPAKGKTEGQDLQKPTGSKDMKNSDTDKKNNSSDTNGNVFNETKEEEGTV